MARIANHLQPSDLKMQKALRREEVGVAGTVALKATRGEGGGGAAVAPVVGNPLEMAQAAALPDPDRGDIRIPVAPFIAVDVNVPGRNIRRRI